MNKKMGIIWGLIAGGLWGLDGVLMGIYFNKLTISSILIAAILGAAIHDGLAAIWIFLKNITSGKVKLYKKALSSKPLILGAILGGPLGMTGNLLGIQLAGASYSSAITACYPVLGTVLGFFFLKEKVKFIGVIGVIFAVIGAVIIGYTEPTKGTFLYFHFGIACSILAVIGWALEGVISTYSMSSIDSDIAIGIREITSFISYVVIIIISALIFQNVRLEVKYLFPLILASVCGAFSYLCWYRAMKNIGVSIAMSLNTTYALWTVVFSIILVGVKLTNNLIIGSIVISLGTILTINGVKNHE